MTDPLTPYVRDAERHRRAIRLDQDLKATEEASSKVAWRQAEILYEIHDRKLYAELKFGNFKEYVETNCDFGCRKALQLVAIHREFVIKHKLDKQSLDQLGISHAAALLPFTESQNICELIEVAKSNSVRQLKEFLDSKHDGSKTIEMPAASVVNVENQSPQENGDWTKYISYRPDPREFHVEEDNWEQCVYGAVSNQNVMVIGPSGCGKTELVSHVARAVGKTFSSFNFGALSMDPRAMLLGTTNLRGGKTFFVKSQFLKAFAEGNHLILLDELNRARAESLNIIIPCLDSQQVLEVSENIGEERIYRGRGTSFFATANMGAVYTGTEELDHAIRDRKHIEIHLDFPNFHAECKILQSRHKNKNLNGVVSNLVKIANDQREMFHDGEFTTAISTRSLLAATQQISDGISVENAFKFCILSKFSGDGAAESEREKLQILFQKY